jgi:hypothetical protein
MANGTIAASQLEMLSQSGTGIITITPPATNTNRAITLPDAAGALVVSGTTPSLNGITFPATQSASADANTLDDYEEGTWTPLVSSTSGSITSYTSSGTYTKIGRLVTATVRIVLTNVGTGSGAINVASIPFTAASTNSFTVAGNENALSGYVLSGNAASTTALNFTKFDGTTAIIVNHSFTLAITYIV